MSALKVFQDCCDLNEQSTSFFLQSLSLRVAERGEDELLHTVALGRALRALTRLTYFSLDYDWDPGDIGMYNGFPEDIAEAVVLMPELRFACSP